MKFLDSEISPMGLGCWPIGGEMYTVNGESVGYTRSNDNDSIKAIHAALANGITLFDTAAAYGAGHSERLLAKALKARPDAIIVTKIGIAIDEATKTLTGEETTPESVMPAIDRCLKRLCRDSIDLLLLHPNEVSIEQAGHIFDELEKAQKLGKGLGKTTGWIHRAALKMKGVEMVGGVNYEKIDAEGLHVSFGEAREKPTLIEADTIVLCAGQLSDRSLADALEAKGKTCHVIGGADVAAELDAKRAIDQGTRLAATL